jgi:hypothetical protein
MEIVEVGGAATGSIAKIFGLITAAVANPIKAVTAVRAATSFIMEAFFVLMRRSRRRIAEEFRLSGIALHS